MRNKQFLGHVAALATVSVWGFSFVAIVTLLRDFSPKEVLFFRFALGIMALYLVYPKPMGKTTRRQELYFAGAGFFGVTLYFMLQGFALLHTAASNVGVIVAVSPVFTVLLSWRLLKDSRPTRTFFLGALLVLGGIGIVRFAGSRLELHPLGDFLALLTAFVWSVYSIITKKIGDFGFHTVQSTRRIFLYGLLFLLPAVIAMDFRLGLERFVAPENIISLLFLGLGSTALCFVLWNFSMEQLGPAKASVYLYLIPLVAVAGSVLFLEEAVGLLKGLGIALALLGLAISNRPRKKTVDADVALSHGD